MRHCDCCGGSFDEKELEPIDITEPPYIVYRCTECRGH